MEEVIAELEKVHPHGLQIARRFGVLSFTRAFYRVGRRYFLFDINDEEFDFAPANGYTRNRLLAEYAGAWYQIDDLISFEWVWIDGKDEPYPPLKKPYLRPG